MWVDAPAHDVGGVAEIAGRDGVAGVRPGLQHHLQAALQVEALGEALAHDDSRAPRRRCASTSARIQRLRRFSLKGPEV